MLLFLIFFSNILVEISPQMFRPRALDVKDVCPNQPKYSYIVSIQRDDEHTCNGVIINGTHIFTTGYCVKEKLECTEKGPNDHIKVLLPYGAEPGLPTQENCFFARVDRCIIHRNYNRDAYSVEYDFAMVILLDHLVNYTSVLFTEERELGSDYKEVCSSGLVAGRWGHSRGKKPKVEIECFQVTIRALENCFEADRFVHMRKKKNHTRTCSFDRSNRNEVCYGFYGAPLICNERVVGLVSHKFNLSEQCLEVSPFYYSRIDWSYDFRHDYKVKPRNKRDVEVQKMTVGGSSSFCKTSFSMEIFLLVFHIVMFWSKIEKLLL